MAIHGSQGILNGIRQPKPSNPNAVPRYRVTLLPGRLEPHCVTVESTSAEDVGISDASGYIEGRCCSHRLNLP